MSDFLAQLAARALAPQPLVRPRLQSFYEPPAPLPSEENFETAPAGLKAPESALSPWPARAEERAAAPHPNAVAPGEPAALPRPQILAPLPMVSEAAGRSAAPAEPSPTREPATHAVTIEPRVILQEPRRVQHAPDAPLNVGPPAATRPAEVPSAAQPRRIPPAGDAESPQRKPAPPENPEIPARVSRPPGNKPAAGPAVVALIKPAQPPRVSDAQRSPPAPPLSPARASAVSPPAVHVTIGRVEIRAVPPPAPARAASVSAAGRLSLEDYLKRNNGGGR